MTDEVIQPEISIQKKCRICGCTEDNCARCIKLTGAPCHWVEEDLCSACVVPIPTEKQAVTVEAKPTNFFSLMYGLLDGLDITIRLKRTAGFIVAEVLPITANIIKPVKLTGSVEEMDEGFFRAINQPVEMTKGLTVDLDEYKKSIAESEKEEVTKPAASKPKSKSNPKDIIKKKADKKAEKPVIKSKPVAPDMFA